MKSKLIVGITGGSGSGKTRFLSELLAKFDSNQIALLSMDNYYKPITEQQIDEKGIENFDLPTAIDRAKFFQDFTKIVQGHDLNIPEYTFNYQDKPVNYLYIKSAEVIVVEGIFTFFYEEIAEALDLKIFIDTPDYLMMKRRILRDATERGYDLQDVLYRYEYHVTPAYNRYILPYRSDADIIIPNHTHFTTGVEVIASYIEKRIS